MNDLTPKRLAAALGGRPHEFYEQIDSTNDRAMALLTEDAPNGTVVIADEQTQGRGRLGRNWHSPPGSSLMLSYLMRPSPTTVGDAGLVGILAVCATVEALGVANVGIKWPNDVQIERRKLCGILPESAWEGDLLRGVVVGIGLNVRVDFTDTPLEKTAISLEDKVRGQVDRLELLTGMLARLDFWTVQMGSKAVFESWRNRLNMLGMTISVDSNGATLQGTAEDVSRDGALLVRTPDGVLHRVVAGDISLGNTP